LRFIPPRAHLRLFGRFIAEDALILTGHGLKSLTGRTGAKPLSVREERDRCDKFLAIYGFDLSLFPQTIRECITNARFSDD
jgi:hypothetical protein